MIAFERLTTFFGWMSVVNIGLFFLTFFVLTALKEVVLPIHSSIFAMNTGDLHRIYFQHVAQYKIAVVVFNIAPYIALKIMGKQSSEQNESVSLA